MPPRKVSIYVLKTGTLDYLHRGTLAGTPITLLVDSGLGGSFISTGAAAYVGLAPWRRRMR